MHNGKFQRCSKPSPRRLTEKVYHHPGNFLSVGPRAGINFDTPSILLDQFAEDR